jgi:hypothetical protein
MTFNRKWIDNPEMAMNMHEYSKAISPTELINMHSTRYCGPRQESKSAYYDYLPLENYYPKCDIRMPPDFSNIYCHLYAAVNNPTNSTPTNHYLAPTHDIQSFIPEEIPFVIFNDEIEDVPDLKSGHSPSAESQDSSQSDSSLGTKTIESQTQDIKLENSQSEPEAESIPSIPDEKTPKIFKCTEKVRMIINN